MGSFISIRARVCGCPALSLFAALLLHPLFPASAYYLPQLTRTHIRTRIRSRASNLYMAVSSKSPRPEPIYPVTRGEPTSASAFLSPQGIGRTPSVSAVRLSHILFRSRDLALETLRRLRGSATEDFRDDLVGSGGAAFVAFGDMARMISDCELTREKGGAIGWVDTAADDAEDAAKNEHLDLIIPAAVRKKLFDSKCKPGDVIATESDRGHHLVQITDVMADVVALSTTKRQARGQKRKRSALAELWEGLEAVAESDAKQLYYSMETMGCQMNAADTERMEGQLENLGVLPLADHPGAIDEGNIGLRRGRELAGPQPDLVLLNTCSIRDHAEQKLYSHLGPHAKRKRNGEDVVLVVAGCVAQQEGEALLRRFPEVDLVMGPQYANRLGDLLEAVGSGHQVVATEGLHVMEDATRPRRGSDVCAWVNVIYGCNERCSYCVVPTTRGIEQSRPVDSIVNEVRSLVAEGYGEVTLLGQNIDAYGRDMKPQRKFSDLLRTVAAVEGLGRLRFVTSHPKYMSLGVVDAVADCAACCDYFHVPFQSGSNEVLARMGRGYTRNRFLAIVDRIRQRCPDAAITADVIVGFPGETEEQFQETLSLMEEVVFDSVNTAAYSPRPNTPAAEWGDQVSDEIKQDRLARINVLNKEHAQRRRARMLNRTVEVLVEQRNIHRPNQVTGRTTHGYIVHLSGDIDELKGRTVEVKIESCHSYHLMAAKDIRVLNDCAMRP